MTKTKLSKKEKEIKPCAAGICGRNAQVLDWCDTHYRRWKKHGDVNICRNDLFIPYATRFWQRVAVTANPEKCWEWLGAKNTKGYGSGGYEGFAIAHRYAWYLANGRRPTKMILHSCDNPSCVNPNHLREGTAKENTQDMIQRGRSAWQNGKRCTPILRGSQTGMSKLTEQQVREIKQLLKTSMFQRDISLIYGVSEPCVSAIKKGQTWRHVE